MNKSAVFFFLRRKKKQPFEIESVSALQTFPGKKKQTKKNNFWKKNSTKISKLGKRKIWGNRFPGISQKLSATQPFYQLYVEKVFEP